MRSALMAAAALAVVGCRQQTPPAPPATLVEWAQPSPDGRLELRERREGRTCRVEAVVKSPDGARSLWSTQTCLPGSRQVFLSANGERVLVLDLIPSGQSSVSDWTRTPLISLWVRGAVVRQYTGSEILGDDQAADMSKVLSWVRGDSYEDAKRAARPSADGEKVTIGLVDGRTLVLGFDGTALPASEPVAQPAPAATRLPDRPAPPEPVAAVPPPRATERSDPATDGMAADETTLYSWTDDQGGMNFGHGAQVPAKYRKRARPVDATVGVIPIDAPKVAPKPAAAGAPGAAPPASAAAPGVGAPVPASGGTPAAAAPPAGATPAPAAPAGAP